MPQKMFREVRRMRDFARKHGFEGLRDFPYAYAYGYRYSKKEPKIFSANWYDLPDVNLVMNQLTKDWKTDNLPISIELENGKVKITHSSLPSPHLSLPARLTLLPELSYLLGFAESIDEEKKFLTFEDSLTVYAPHPPHCFAELVEEKLRNLLKQLNLKTPANIIFKMQDMFTKMLDYVDEKLKEKDALCLESQKKLEEELNKKEYALCDKANEKLREDHHHEMNELYIQSEDTINNLKRFYEREIQNLNKEHDSRLKEQTEKFEEDMDLEQDDRKKEVDGIKKDHQVELEKVRDTIQNQTDEVKEKLMEMHRKELEVLSEKHQAELDKASQEVQNQNSLGMLIHTPMIIDCRDRINKKITPIASFDGNAEKWQLKGVVVSSGEVDVGNDESLFTIQFEDYSGSIEIAAFGPHGKILQDLAIVGKEYYVEMLENWEMDTTTQSFNVDNFSRDNFSVIMKNNQFNVRFVDVVAEL